jgi:hypothetical protein
MPGGQIKLERAVRQIGHEAKPGRENLIVYALGWRMRSIDTRVLIEDVGIPHLSICMVSVWKSGDDVEGPSWGAC